MRLPGPKPESFNFPSCPYLSYSVDLSSVFDKGFSTGSERRNDEPSLLEQALKKKMVGEVRINNGRNEKTSFCIVDAQSVKNTDTAKHKGYDGGKKVSGIKRHIAVDTQEPMLQIETVL